MCPSRGSGERVKSKIRKDDQRPSSFFSLLFSLYSFPSTLPQVKIALIILHADPARGGAERYTYDLCTGLQARGHESSTIAASFDPARTCAGAIQLNAGGGTRVGQYNRFLAQLDSHLREHRYDIVHAMLPVRRCDVYHPHAGIAADALRNGHLKYEGPVLQFLSQVANRSNLRRQRFAAVERALLTGKEPPVVLCLSDYVKRTLRAHYPLEDSRLATLFNATDLNRFNPAVRPDAGLECRKKFGISDDRVVGLMIAQDFHRKGLAEAIAALARIEDRRLVLLVVGKPDPGPYLNIARNLNVADRVIFAGSTTDPYPFYRSADFFVLPTRHDPCSLVVLEALAMGLPVISTAMNGACEIMTDATHGFVLPDPADVSALAAAMRKLLDDPTRTQMRQACLALRPRLAYERHLDELLRIYGEMSRK